MLSECIVFKKGAFLHKRRSGHNGIKSERNPTVPSRPVQLHVPTAPLSTAPTFRSACRHRLGNRPEVSWSRLAKWCCGSDLRGETLAFTAELALTNCLRQGRLLVVATEGSLPTPGPPVLERDGVFFCAGAFRLDLRRLYGGNMCSQWVRKPAVHSVWLKGVQVKQSDGGVKQSAELEELRK